MTYVFLPDTTGLDLKEQERRWNYIRAGREQDYHGIAIHPRHLSLWERFRGIHKNYNADLDYASKIEEMREEWTEWEQRKAEEHAKDGDDDDDEWSEEVSTYFRRLAPPSATSSLEKEKEKERSSDDEKTLGDQALSR